jgi:glutamate 5-kinase
MATKLSAARLCVENGCDMIITNGSHPEYLYDIMDGKNVGTRFVSLKKGE